MKFKVLALAISLALISTASSHGGRTDKKGGHKCSKKSQKKGLCSGYHYHKSEQLYYPKLLTSQRLPALKK